MTFLKIYDGGRFMTKKYIAWETAKTFMETAFEKIGLPKEDAVICSEILLESDRRGINSHGVNRFKPIYIDRINAGILIRLLK